MISGPRLSITSCSALLCYFNRWTISKNKRGNKCDSNHYRQIAIRSLLGKILNIIILEKQQISLETDILQFGYKNNLYYFHVHVKRTIGYYNDNSC